MEAFHQAMQETASVPTSATSTTTPAARAPPNTVDPEVMKRNTLEQERWHQDYLASIDYEITIHRQAIAGPPSTTTTTTAGKKIYGSVDVMDVTNHLNIGFSEYMDRQKSSLGNLKLFQASYIQILGADDSAESASPKSHHTGKIKALGSFQGRVRFDSPELSSMGLIVHVRDIQSSST